MASSEFQRTNSENQLLLAKTGTSIQNYSAKIAKIMKEWEAKYARAAAL